MPRRRPRGEDGDRHRHQEVHVNTLRLTTVLPFRLFTEIEGEYLLYRREDLPFTQTQRNALLENGIECLYVSPEEVTAYWDYLRRGIRSILDDADLPLEVQATTFYTSSSEVTRQLLITPVDENMVSTAQTLVAESVKFQHQGKGALHALMADMRTQPSVYHHSLNVCQYGLALAQSLGFGQQDLEDLGFGMLFQDLGMLRIPDSIVQKNGPLSFEEWNTLKKHPSLSLEALDRVEGISEVARTVVFSHHERLDGSGYPQGLRGEEVPMLVRIAAVGDIFTSLTTTRPYRPANSTFDALRIMNTEMRAALDAQVLKAFIRLLGR